jgi:hypothetical protein
MFFNTRAQINVQQIVDAAIAALVDSAPETLDTLNKLAQALNDDENFAVTVAVELSGKADADDVYTKIESDNLLDNKADLDKPNSFVVGGHIITSAGAGEVPLVLKGTAGQTANLVEIKNSSNVNRLTVSDTGYTALANLQSDGGIRIGTSVTYSTNQRWLSITNNNTIPSSVTSGTILYAENGELEVRTPLANIGLTAKKVSVQSDSYSFVGADQGALVGLTGSNNRTFTLPNDSTVNFPVGTEIQVATFGTGHLTIAANSPATVVGKSLTLNQQYSTGRVIKTAANSWFFCSV